MTDLSSEFAEFLKSGKAPLPDPELKFNRFQDIVDSVPRMSESQAKEVLLTVLELANNQQNMIEYLAKKLLGI
jgi:hypothetical protein